MSTEQITVRLPSEMVETLRGGAKAARRSLAAEIAFMLDRSPLGNAEPVPPPPKLLNSPSTAHPPAEDDEIEELTREPDPDHLAHENRPVGSPATKALALMRGRPTDFPAKPPGQKTVKPKGRK